MLVLHLLILLALLVIKPSTLLTLFLCSLGLRSWLTNIPRYFSEFDLPISIPSRVYLPCVVSIYVKLVILKFICHWTVHSCIVFSSPRSDLSSYLSVICRFTNVATYSRIQFFFSLSLSLSLSLSRARARTQHHTSSPSAPHTLTMEKFDIPWVIPYLFLFFLLL